MFEIIIPVTINYEMAQDLLCSIEANSILPSRVIIIDNSEGDQKGFAYKTNLFQLDIYRDGFRRYCNHAWNTGIERLSKDCKFVSILNDDIVLGPYFFEKIKYVFDNNPRAGAACPLCIDNPGYVLSELRKINKDKNANKVNRMRHREGGAFTIRKDVLDQIPPIPEELTTFYGDNWFWWWTYKRGYLWMKNSMNIIYHLGSVTVKALGQNEQFYHKEKIAYCRIIEEIKKNHLDYGLTKEDLR